MQPLAPNILAIPPQGVRVIMELASHIPDAIHMEVGEPSFPTPQHIIDAAIARLQEDGRVGYTPNAGMYSLREAIAEKMGRFNGVTATANQIVVTPGAVAALAGALMVVANTGDSVLMPEPYWPNGSMWLGVLGVERLMYSLRQENGFLPDLAELERLVKPTTKALVINSPANPTGAVFPAETMQALLDFCRRHDLWLISDEIYEHIVFDGNHVSPATFDTDGRVITISGMSKAYAMTGWRVGYAVTNTDVAQQLAKVQEPITSCVNTIAQVAAEAALRGPQDVVEEMRLSYKQRRDLVVALLRDAGLYRYSPTGAFYAMVDIRDSGLTSMEFAKALLREKHVAVSPGTAFGDAGEGFVRVSLATEESLLVEGVGRLVEYVKERARD